MEREKAQDPGMAISNMALEDLTKLVDKMSDDLSFEELMTTSKAAFTAGIILGKEHDKFIAYMNDKYHPDKYEGPEIDDKEI